jgi:tetratricopeptide (TPR) repeat protein
MASKTGDSGGRLTVSRALVPLVSLGIIFLLWRSGNRWVTIPVLILLLLYYFALPKLVENRLKHFRRDALQLFTSNRANEVPGLVRRNIVLQLFGSPGPLDAQLGLAYVYCGEFARAVPCLESAVHRALPEEKITLQVGLTKALFMTGDLQRAELAGRAVLDHGTRLPELLALVARARIGLGKIDQQTTAYLDEAATLSTSHDVSAMITLGYEECKARKKLEQSGGDTGKIGTALSAQKSAARRRRKGR